jgi:multidrug resistance efflux pump
MPFALSQQNSPQPRPLTDSEKQQIWEFLTDYKNLIGDSTAYKAEVEKLLAADEQQQIEYVRRIGQEKANAALAQKETELAQQQVQFYKAALTTCQKAGKKGVGCFFKRLFTLFIAQCH